MRRLRHARRRARFRSSLLPSPPAALLGLLAALAWPAPPPAAAAPVIVESGWTLLRSHALLQPQSAVHNPVDGRIYVGRRGSGSDGVYRFHPYGYAVKLTSASNPAGLVADPATGDVFHSEDYGGYIYRTAFGATGRQTWVSGLHSGDDDPIGLAIAPAGYAGPILAAGDALVADRGYTGLDEIWRWSPVVAEGETAVHADAGVLVDAVDLTFTADAIWVVDSGDAGPGVIYRLEADSTLTPLATSEPLAHPLGVATDGATGDLLVLDQASGRLVRVVTATGQVSDVVTGLSLTGDSWAGVDASADGHLLVLTEDTPDDSGDAVHVLARCDATGAPELDCDGNGVLDECDIAVGTLPDCNENGVPDPCDIESGASGDCNEDGIPDDCPLCPPVELVFVMDTSTSMDDEAASLCATIGYVVAHLSGAHVDVVPTYLAIANLPGGAYSCLTGTVVAELGVAVPGNPPAYLDTLGACPGGLEVIQEDWALATAIVAGLYPWQPEGESIRLVVPLSDEGPWCGDPVTTYDEQATSQAIAVARDAGVVVSPVTGSGSGSAVIALAQQLADSTGGVRFSSSVPAADLAEGIRDIILAACLGSWDCNGNGVPDECDIAAGTSRDSDGNGRPDECDLVGVRPDQGPPARTLGLTCRPNPFNPAVTISFSLPVESEVELAVFGLDGRRLATVTAGRLPAGPHQVRWAARDDRGRRLPSGVYLGRLRAAGMAEVARLVLIR